MTQSLMAHQQDDADGELVTGSSGQDGPELPTLPGFLSERQRQAGLCPRGFAELRPKAVGRVLALSQISLHTDGLDTKRLDLALFKSTL
jgi:hypothetical protein